MQMHAGTSTAVFGCPPFALRATPVEGAPDAESRSTIIPLKDRFAGWPGAQGRAREPASRRPDGAVGFPGSTRPDQVARVRGRPRGRRPDHRRCRPMPHPRARIRRVFELVEPIATVTFSEVPNEAFLALGMRNYWDGYFAGRAAPLGLGWCTRSSTTSPMARWHATSRGFGGRPPRRRRSPCASGAAPPRCGR
jgi:helix-turn-helix protein